MSEIEFPEDDFGWDGDRFALLFGARKDNTRFICMISGEALLDHFGSAGVRESMVQAFLRNREVIEEKAREMIEQGLFEPFPPGNPLGADHRLLIRSRDFSPAPVSASAS